MTIIQVTKAEGRLVSLSENPELDIKIGYPVPDKILDQVLLQVETYNPLVAAMLSKYAPLMNRGVRTFFEGGVV